MNARLRPDSRVFRIRLHKMQDAPATCSQAQLTHVWHNTDAWNRKAGTPARRHRRNQWKR